MSFCITKSSFLSANFVAARNDKLARPILHFPFSIFHFFFGVAARGRYNRSMTLDPGALNLPHALTIVGRLALYLEPRREPVPVEETQVREHLESLYEVLGSYTEDPPAEVALPAAAQAAEVARRLAEEIARAGYTGDRIGQCIRNLFECLGLAAEGAALSLRCGERPNSPLRP